MGKVHILTKEQQVIYSEVALNNYIRKNFYFTGEKIEPLILASDFLKVEDFTFLPRMVNSLTLAELQSFIVKRRKI